MGLVLDIILAAAVLIAVIRGGIDGFIKSVMRLLSWFISLIVSVVFYSKLANVLYEKVFLGSMTENISKTIRGFMDSASGFIDIPSLFSEKPAAFAELFEKYNVDIDAAQSEYYSIASSVTDTSEIIERLSEYLAKKLAASVSNILAFIAIFLVSFILLKIITVILDNVFSSAALNAVNRVGGIVFGLISGVLICSVILLVVSYAEPILIKLYPDVFTGNITESSIIVNFISELKTLQPTIESIKESFLS